MSASLAASELQNQGRRPYNWPVTGRDGDLRAPGPRVRAGRGRLARHDGRRALPRLCLGRRGQRAGPRPPAPRRGADRAGAASSGTPPISTGWRARSGSRERLVAATFADRVFFCNSGAEACEAAIKAARRYHYVSGQPERWRIVTFEGAFHGRTLATIAAGGNAQVSRGLRAAGRGLRPGAVRRSRRGRKRRSGRRRPLS